MVKSSAIPFASILLQTPQRISFSVPRIENPVLRPKLSADICCALVRAQHWRILRTMALHRVGPWSGVSPPGRWGRWRAPASAIKRFSIHCGDHHISRQIWYAHRKPIITSSPQAHLPVHPAFNREMNSGTQYASLFQKNNDIIPGVPLRCTYRERLVQSLVRHP